MTSATYLQRGEALDYINSTNDTIPAGVVVEIGSRIGVTGTDILPGRVGSLHVCGVFEFAKTGSAAIPMGTPVYFDGDGITAEADDGEDDPTAYTPAGYAAASAAATDATILVKING